MKKVVLLILLANLGACKSETKENIKDQVVAQEMTKDLQKSISEGAELYNNFCASCHLSSGEGISGTFPPLKNTEWLSEKRVATIQAVKFGLNGPIKVNGEVYDNLMPDLGLTDKEITDILNYVGHSWGNDLEKPFSVEEVSAIEK